MTTVNMAIPLILICFLVKNTIKKYLGDIILYESFPKVSYISYFYYMQLLFMQPFFFCQSRISAERSAFLTAAAIK